MQDIDWPQVVEEHGSLVWQTAQKLLGDEADAADCFQETFLRALTMGRRTRIRSVSALLARIASNCAMDRLRQRFRESRRRVTSPSQADVQSVNPGPVHQVQRRELAEKVRENLSQLRRREMEVFCLRYLNDMEYSEIAEELNITPKTAGAHLARARAKLRDLLGQDLKV